MEYFTSDSYKNFERIGEPFEKNGKLYTEVKDKCDRCVRGIYAIGVENGQIKPHPAFGGICLKCNGSGWLHKEVRLYTKAEYETMKRNNERVKARKEQEKKEKIEREFEDNKKKWLEKNGFAEDGTSYIITGDSYSIKEELKATGWKYDPILKWHKADPAGYEDRTVKINVEDCFAFSAWGEGKYLTTAKEFVDNLLNEAKEPSVSEWVGEVGERLKKIPVTLIGVYGFDGKYGYSQVIKFQDENGNTLTWFTAVHISVQVGDSCLLTGTVKKHDEYKGEKTTILTRCRIEA